MRILYVTAIGASARYFLTTHFSALRNQGHEIALACTDDPDTRNLASECQITFLPVKICTRISLVNDMASVAHLLLLLRSYKPDVVHAHMSKAGCLTMLAARVAGVKHRVYHNHGLSCLNAQGLKRTSLKSLEKISCHCATTVLFCSPSTKSAAVEHQLCLSHKARVLGNGSISGIDTDRFHPRRSNATLDLLRADIGLPQARHTVGFVGRLVAHKGLHNLLDAWQQLPRALYDDSVLLICGGYPSAELLARVITMTQTHKNIVYAGSRSDMADVYGLLDLLVLPSWYEGFPYSVLEAQASGVPAIVTRVPGNLDAVIDHRTGMIIEPENTPALVAALDVCLRDDARRADQAHAARQRVVEQFSEPVVLANLIAFYDELAALRLR